MAYTQLPGPPEDPISDAEANHRYAGRVVYEKVLPVAAFLPIGIRSYWGLLEPTARFVATEGSIEDWSAYVAPPSTSTEEAARRGQKLPMDVATRIFPLLNPSRYRS